MAETKPFYLNPIPLVGAPHNQNYTSEMNARMYHDYKHLLSSNGSSDYTNSPEYYLAEVDRLQRFLHRPGVISVGGFMDESFRGVRVIAGEETISLEDDDSIKKLLLQQVDFKWSVHGPLSYLGAPSGKLRVTYFFDMRLRTGMPLDNIVVAGYEEALQKPTFGGIDTSVTQNILVDRSFIEEHGWRVGIERSDTSGQSTVELL